MDPEQVKAITSTAKFGDLIEFAFPIGYSHWAVYDGDGHVIHFAVADEGELMTHIRTYLRKMIPSSGDILLGMTKIRRMLLRDVNFPTGTKILIGNDCHAFTPSASEDMRRRRDALLDQEFQYNLFTLNCEHFATFVRYGKAVCNQFPFKSKNDECVKATEAFEGIVKARSKADDPSLCSIV